MAIEKNIRCTVLRDSCDSADSRARPSDLVPWADPYIASLVRKLQREVRQEASHKETAATDNQRVSAWDVWDMCYDDTPPAATKWEPAHREDREFAGV